MKRVCRIYTIRCWFYETGAFEYSNISVVKFLLSVGLCLISGGFALRAQQAIPEQKKPDAFFSGAVTDAAPDTISVARRISGKLQKRTFRVTPQTRVEGKLQPKVRVTVQYSTDDQGVSTATRIVVHTPAPKK